MERIEKLKLAVKKGFTYCEKTGNIKSPTNKICKKKTKNGYIMLTVRDENSFAYYVYGHQFAWFIMYNETVALIDHKNRIKTDNRKDNLRSVTKSQNAMNQSNAKGCSFDKKKSKFESYINVDNKKIHLGWFESEAHAKNCYLENKNKYHIIN